MQLYNTSAMITILAPAPTHAATPSVPSLTPMSLREGGPYEGSFHLALLGSLDLGLVRCLASQILSHSFPGVRDVGDIGQVRIVPTSLWN